MMELTKEIYVPQIQVVEFLAEAIHIQLVNLNTMKHFRYHSYLMSLFFHYNQESFPDLFKEESMTSVYHISFVNKDQNEGMFKFFNKIISKAFKLSFGEELPIILEELKNNLQLSPQTRVGDWFLFENHTMIKVYGSEYEPFLLLSCLIPRIYALEYIRHIFTLDYENFGKYKKAITFKLPFILGPLKEKRKKGK